jgi:hypothetical protein
VRSPREAWRNRRGDTPAARWKVRTKLAEHHHLGERRRAADLPRPGPVGDRVDQLGAEVERQAAIAVRMIVGADVLVARPADQQRAGDQLVAPPAAQVAEAPRPHVRDGVCAVALDEPRLAGPGGAAVVDDAQRPAVQDRRGAHDGHSTMPVRPGHRFAGLRGKPHARSRRANPSRFRNPCDPR